MKIVAWLKHAMKMRAVFEVNFPYLDVPLKGFVIGSVGFLPPPIYKPFISTPLKINIEPENDGLQNVFPLPGVYSQVPC